MHEEIRKRLLRVNRLAERLMVEEDSREYLFDLYLALVDFWVDGVRYYRRHPHGLSFRFKFRFEANERRAFGAS